MHLLLLYQVVVALHELGHYVTLRAAGYQVTAVALGNGPVIRSWTIRGVRWEQRLLPIGGFV